MVIEVVNAILSAFLGADLNLPVYCLAALVTMIGLSFVFGKCGAQKWKAFIPWIRQVELGKCAGREREGRMLGFLEILVIVLDNVSRITGVANSENIPILFMVVTLLVSVIEMIYRIRVYAGLCEVFDKSKAWTLLWIIPYVRVIPALVWGLHKKYQPQWTMAELQSEAANFFSNNRAEVLDQGLTVNLEERTVTEMFQKKYLLRDIHLYIRPGHMVLLLGGSGAGKTTFLNAVNGYEKAKAEVVLTWASYPRAT